MEARDYIVLGALFTTILVNTATVAFFVGKLSSASAMTAAAVVKLTELAENTRAEVSGLKATCAERGRAAGSCG